MRRLAIEKHERARIEIVPLIDIMFFLLATFIMVSLSMTKNQGMQVQLPGASTAEKQKQDDQNKAVTLTVKEDGQIFYNKEKISAAQLPVKLRTYKGGEKDPKVIVNADASVDFKKVVAVLDEARKQGILKVGISTEKR